MKEYCDLHCHSTFSDGTDTPEQLLRQAEALGLSAIALTDHNTVAGLPAFLEAAKGYDVEAVPGTEFSTVWRGIELHILGLFLKPEDFETVTKKLEVYNQRKEQSNVDLVWALEAGGYHLDYEKIKASTPNGQVNRALIAAELTRLGYTQSNQEAFKKLLNPSRGYYTPPQRFTPFEIIVFIKSLGAVAVWAHPLLSLNPQQARDFLREVQGHGLDGMEVFYFTYDGETTKTACALAEEFALAYSGGSDYHGHNKPDIRMGAGKGDLAIPTAFLDGLKAIFEKQK